MTRKPVPYSNVYPDGWVEICCGNRDPHTPHLSFKDGAWKCEGRDNCKKCYINAATVISISGFWICRPCGELDGRFWSSTLAVRI